jgi:hypothetical protein
MSEEKQDILMWYLSQGPEPEPGKVYYSQSVPVKSLEAVRDKYDSLKQDADNLVKALERIKDKSIDTMDIALATETLSNWQAKHGGEG